MNTRNYKTRKEQDIILQEDTLLKSLAKAEEEMTLGFLAGVDSKNFKLLFECVDLVKNIKFHNPTSSKIVDVIANNKDLLAHGNENRIFMLKELNEVATGYEIYLQAFNQISMYGFNLVYLKHYTERFIDLSKKLEMRTNAYELAELCTRSEYKSFEVSEHFRKISDKYESTKEISNIGDIAKSIQEDISKGSNNQLISTGFYNLDFRLQGFMSEELIILAGRPGTGKTAFALNLSLKIAEKGKSVLFVSLEMGDKSLTARAISNLGNIEADFYRQKKVNSQEDFTRAVQTLESLPVSIFEKSNNGKVTVSKIKERALKVENLGLIVVDYLQLVKSDERYGNREQEVSSISRELKLMALELQVPVMALAQLNRNVETTGAEPKASDLRESGAIEQDADIIMMLHAKKDMLESDVVPVKCKIVKSRSTAIGTCFFDFKKSHSRFVVGSAWEDTKKDKKTNFWG